MKYRRKMMIILLVITIVFIPSQIYANTFANSFPRIFLKSDRVIKGNCKMSKVFFVGNNEVINITGFNKTNGRVTIFIEDETGRVVSDALILEPGTNRMKMDKATIYLPKGMYFLRAKGSKNVWNGKEHSTGKIGVIFKCKKEFNFFF